jgi:transcriptional regulator
MYSPPYNQVKERREVVEFMRANNFPLLVTAAGGAPRASHLPVTIHEEGEQIVIDMHMAKANPQWREFSAAEVMVVFSGPHAYITPRWYEEKERVPTWNYTAVHAYGVPQVFEDREVKHASQRRLIEMMDPQWLPQHDALGEAYVTMMLRGIVNFRIPVTRLETRWKLSQNKGRHEMERIAAELDKSADPMERALAALTRKHLPDK